jgi:hypothetical protein
MTPACRYAVAALLTLTAGCDPGGDGTTQDPPRLPMYFWLNADAFTEEDGLTVECDIEYIVEVHGEVSRTDAVVEYVATMGGSASRRLYREDRSGVEFWADAYYPDVQVLHVLPDRVQLVARFPTPSDPEPSPRFWLELVFWDGRIRGNSVISGEWLCAPLYTEQGGINDDHVLADGTWETEEIEGR